MARKAFLALYRYADGAVGVRVVYGAQALRHLKQELAEECAAGVWAPFRHWGAKALVYAVSPDSEAVLQLVERVS